MWIAIELYVVEPHALQLFCTCQLDLVTVSELGSIERFSTTDSAQQVINPGAMLI